MGTVAAPTSDLELYSDDALLDPYPRHRELRALLTALLPRVERFELVEAVPKLNNILHGLGTCVVTVGPCP